MCTTHVEFGCRLHQIAVLWSCSRASRTRYGLRIEASSAKSFGNEFHVMGNDYFNAACSMIDASSKWSAQLITLHNELCGAAPSTSATLCTASFKFSLTTHSSSLQFKYDGRSSIQFIVQFSLVYSLQFEDGGCSSMQFTVTVQFISIHNLQYRQTRSYGYLEIPC